MIETDWKIPFNYWFRIGVVVSEVLPSTDPKTYKITTYLNYDPVQIDDYIPVNADKFNESLSFG
ncbi:hypothetical protein COB52_04955 [Candidatus Kaiserbacteria bacterium]|nr:MAG: hypothetical protein COB52_04955 [Candidatus Kaiserbacteria bacterium]